jgi:RNA polymerase sigma-70 factor (ECF subfamily)
MTERPASSSGDGPGATSLTLLERARCGADHDAWERLVSLYDPLVSRWCRQAGLQDADVADVRQEVLAQVARSLPTFERSASHGSFRGWLRRITQNKVHDLFRQRGDAPQGRGGSDADQWMHEVPVPQDDSSALEEVGILYRRALELTARDFGEQTWKAFWRVVIDGQRPIDVAGELGMTAGAVSSAKARVLARLRQEFAGLLGEGPDAEPCGLPGGESQGAGLAP